MGSTTNSTYRDSHTRAGKAGEYESHFDYPHRAFLWSREKIILDEIVQKHYAENEFDYLDFACGTGRIVAHLERRARTSVGVDVSEEMLSLARQRVDRTHLVRADITRENPFGNRRFNLITSFRFLLNAEQSLRREALASIAGLLSADGFFVFNNHMNRYSATGMAIRMNGFLRGRTCRTLALGEVRQLLSTAGLQIVETYHTGVLPGFERIILMPTFCHALLESAFSRISLLRHIAQDQIIVCRSRH